MSVPITNTMVTAAHSIATRLHRREGNRPSGNSNNSPGRKNRTAPSVRPATAPTAGDPGSRSTEAEDASQTLPIPVATAQPRNIQPIGFPGTRKHSRMPTPAHANSGAAGLRIHHTAPPCETANPSAPTSDATDATPADHTSHSRRLAATRPFWQASVRERYGRPHLQSTSQPRAGRRVVYTGVISDSIQRRLRAPTGTFVIAAVVFGMALATVGGAFGAGGSRPTCRPLPGPAAARRRPT